MTGRPPRRKVWVGGFSHLNLPESKLCLWWGRVIELESVHVLHIESQRTRTARQLDPQGVLASGREPGSLIRGEHTGDESTGGESNIVHGDGAASIPGRPRQPHGCFEQSSFVHERLEDA